MSFDGPHYEVFKEFNLGQPINGYQITEIFEGWPLKIKVVAFEITENKKVIIEFNKLIDSQTEQIKKAASIYQSIDHPNIIKVEKIFIYKEYLCLVFPFIWPEDFVFLLHTSFPKGMPEYLAGKIIYQMLDALRYIHSLGICHNNITNDNILLLQEQKKFILSDFTHSFISSSKCIFSAISEYSAPEKIKHEPFDMSSDMWSLGVSLFVMLSGQLPFPSYISNQQECIETILSGQLNYQLLVDAGVSEGAINLIQSLCKVDPRQRITAEEAITNEWVIKNGKENESKEYFSKLEKDLIESEMDEVETGGNPLPNEKKMKNRNNATCSACMKEFDKEKGVYVLPNMFLCREDFDRFQNGTLPKEIIDEYNIKHAKNSIIELFTPIIEDNNIDTSNYPPEEVFIDSEMISTAQFLSKFSKYFVPTATFHLPIQLEEINIKEIIALFPSEAKIVSIERGSTFLTVAFIITDKLQRTKEKYQQLINQINDKLIAWGGPIMGKMIEEPQINIPNIEDISNTIVNFIQHTEIVNQINFNDIIQEVQQMISEQSNKDWEFILKHKDLYDEAEK